ASSRILSLGTVGLKVKSKSSTVLACSKLARRSRMSSCLASRRSTSSVSSRWRNSLGARLSSAAWRTRRSRDWRTPERRSLLSGGMSSSRGCRGSLLVGVREQRVEIAGKAGGRQSGRWGSERQERLLVECLGEDRLERGIAIAAVEMRAGTRGAGPGEGEAL